MKRQILVLIILTIFSSSVSNAQRKKPDKNEQQTNTIPQVSLEQRLGELSREISDELTGNQKTTVAVAEFADLRGNSSDFGKFLAEELTTRLFKTKKLKVIERQLLNKVIAEQKLSLTEVIEASAAKRIGRILGVDAIVSGTISDLGKTLKINARIIGTETGEVFAAAATEIVKDESVCSLINCSGGIMYNTGEAQSSKPKPISTPTPKPTPNPTPIRQIPTTWKVDSNFLTFDLQRCRISGGSVLCEFLITNNDKDKNFYINAYNSRIFDDYGNESRARDVQVANSSNGNATLISGVSVRARITFENISSEATKITKFFLCADIGNGSFYVEYRNIPLRDQAFLESNSDSSTQASTQSKPQNQKIIKVYPGQQWTDSGIDVSPGMKLNILVGGVLTAKVDNSGASTILSGILKPVNVPPTTKTVGAKALLGKIRYTNGNDSNIIAVGDSNELIVEEGEYGRLYFGVNQNYANSSGYFSISVKW